MPPGTVAGTSPSPPSGVAPDWQALAGDVTCPLCDYNLRGLSDPRCPECGYAFAWTDLFDESRRRHAYLFEHHSERNVRSFVRTWLNNLRPRRFWGSLHAWHRLRPARLVLYWTVATLLGLSVFVAAPVGHVAAEFREAVESRARLREYARAPSADPRVTQLVRQLGGVDAYVDRLHPSPLSTTFLMQSFQRYRATGHLVPSLLTYVAWPWLTFVVLMIFQGSMRRATVSRGHVLRCVLYSCDAAPIVGILFVIALPWADPDVWRPLRYLEVPGSRTLVQLAGSLVILLWTTPRLASAYARYLRFDHPFATALSSQVIVLLLVAAGAW